MRIFLLPISTRRTLLYCERLHDKLASERTVIDKVTTKANETWAAWEKDEKAPLNWKKRITVYGNAAFKRIPYEEWGLKTLPALTAKRKQSMLDSKEQVEIKFPGLFLREERVSPILQQLATERQGLHRKNLIWSVVGMPFTIPFALIPVIPNLPFFYLVFRAYSHWKALKGSRFLEFLLQNKLTKAVPSSEMDEVYTAGLMHPTRQQSREAPRPTQEQIEKIAEVVHQQTNNDTEDVMVLQRWNGKLIAERFTLPEMEVEIERAVEQVEKDIKAKEELIEEKKELEQATETGKATIVDEKKAEQTEKEIHQKAEDIAKK